MTPHEQYAEAFQQAKQQSRHFIASGGIDTDGYTLDPEIRDLVVAVNGLPFACTWGSCSGHFIPREDILAKARRDETPYFLLQLPTDGRGFNITGRLAMYSLPREQTNGFDDALRALVASSAEMHIQYFPRGLIQSEDPAFQELTYIIRFEAEHPPGVPRVRASAPPSLPTEEGVRRRQVTLEYIDAIRQLCSQF